MIQIGRRFLGDFSVPVLRNFCTAERVLNNLVHPTLRPLQKAAETLVADANTGWTRADAARVVASVEGLDVYIEQPCPTYDECLSVRRRATEPFVLDEVITSTK